jgi:hypothetical protein
MNYSELKQRNIEQKLCVRSGCGNACQEDHLLCEGCADDHRERNARTMRRTRAWKRVQLWLGFEVTR